MSKYSLILLACVSSPRSAYALQSLAAFVSSAKTQNLDQREAMVTAEQRAQEASQAWSRLSPTVVAKASYTHNQYTAILTLPATGGDAPATVTITPQDQLDASFTASLPLVDVGAWQRIGAARAVADAARLRVQATAVDVEKMVVRGYYQLVASEATLSAAEQALATARQSQAIVSTRREAGAASDLDVERASAEVERAKQVVASAEQGRALARRSLESLSGLRPAEGMAALPEDELGDEPPLVLLEPGAAQLPSVRAAERDTKAAAKQADVAWAALMPTITATATERFTNATGFLQRVGSFTAGVAATWTIDPSTVFAARAQTAGHAAAAVRERRVLQAARDALHASWQEVHADVARARAARAEAEASARAAGLARERYLAGTATQLDVQQADRDAFNSEVARIQAYADLAYARAAVRLDSGRTQ